MCKSCTIHAINITKKLEETRNNTHKGDSSGGGGGGFHYKQEASPTSTQVRGSLASQAGGEPGSRG